MVIFLFISFLRLALATEAQNNESFDLSIENYPIYSGSDPITFSNAVHFKRAVLQQFADTEFYQVNSREAALFESFMIAYAAHQLEVVRIGRYKDSQDEDTWIAKDHRKNLGAMISARTVWLDVLNDLKNLLQDPGRSIAKFLDRVKLMIKDEEDYISGYVKNYRNLTTILTDYKDCQFTDPLFMALHIAMSNFIRNTIITSTGHIILPSCIDFLYNSVYFQAALSFGKIFTLLKPYAQQIHSTKRRAQKSTQRVSAHVTKFCSSGEARAEFDSCCKGYEKTNVSKFSLLAGSICEKHFAAKEHELNKFKMELLANPPNVTIKTVNAPKRLLGSFIAVGDVVDQQFQFQEMEEKEKKKKKEKEKEKEKDKDKDEANVAVKVERTQTAVNQQFKHQDRNKDKEEKKYIDTPSMIKEAQAAVIKPENESFAVELIDLPAVTERAVDVTSEKPRSSVGIELTDNKESSDLKATERPQQVHTLSRSLRTNTIAYDDSHLFDQNPQPTPEELELKKERRQLRKEQQRNLKSNPQPKAADVIRKENQERLDQAQSVRAVEDVHDLNILFASRPILLSKYYENKSHQICQQSHPKKSQFRWILGGLENEPEITINGSQFNSLCIIFRAKSGTVTDKQFLKLAKAIGGETKGKTETRVVQINETTEASIHPPHRVDHFDWPRARRLLLNGRITPFLFEKID